MKLVHKWYLSWSFWLMIVTSALGAAELALPLFNGVIPQKAFAIASMITAVLAAIARTIQQKSMHDEGAEK